MFLKSSLFLCGLFKFKFHFFRSLRCAISNLYSIQTVFVLSLITFGKVISPQCGAIVFAALFVKKSFEARVRRQPGPKTAPSDPIQSAVFFVDCG